MSCHGFETSYTAAARPMREVPAVRNEGNSVRPGRTNPCSRGERLAAPSFGARESVRGGEHEYVKARGARRSTGCGEQDCRADPGVTRGFRTVDLINRLDGRWRRE